MSKPSPASKGVTGEVTRFDASRGVAEVRLAGGSVAEMHAGAFLSGRPARLPSVGDAVVAQVRTADGRAVVVAARPVSSPRTR